MSEVCTCLESISSFISKPVKSTTTTEAFWLATQKEKESKMTHERRSLILYLFTYIILIGSITIIGFRCYEKSHPRITSDREIIIPDQTVNETYITNGWMPDPRMTPGAIFPNATAEMVSKPGYASSVRDVPQSEKDSVYREYKILRHNPGDYEVDHLISLELGGSNDIKNLWPEPYHGAWNAHLKDKLENKLHLLVKEGKIPLEQAQREIATDWITAYKKYVSAE